MFAEDVVLVEAILEKAVGNSITPVVLAITTRQTATMNIHLPRFFGFWSLTWVEALISMIGEVGIAPLAVTGVVWVLFAVSPSAWIDGSEGTGVDIAASVS